MRLVRNQTEDGKCKYALVRMDRLRAMKASDDPRQISRANFVEGALEEMHRFGVLEFAGKNDPEECFVIKLKDVHAPPALFAYAKSANEPGPNQDIELALEVTELASRARNHPQRHRPDTIHPVA